MLEIRITYLLHKKGFVVKNRLFFSLIILFFLVSCAAQRAYEKGLEFERQGNLDEAIYHYGMAISREPGNALYKISFEKTRQKVALEHARKGDILLKQSRYEDAIIEYQTAVSYDPAIHSAEFGLKKALSLKDSEYYYKKGMEALSLKKENDAKLAFKRALEIYPGHEAAKKEMDLLLSKKTSLKGQELSLRSTKPVTLKFNNMSIRHIFSVLANLSGINFIFDDEIKETKANIDLEKGTFYQALELLLTTGKLSAKTVNEKTIILYPRTPQKAKQYEDMLVHTFYLSNMDTKKAVNLVRTIIQSKNIYVNEDINALVVRDTPEKIEIAKKVIETNDIASSEVLLETEILEIANDDSHNFGLLLSKYAVSSGVQNPFTSVSSNPLVSDTLTSSSTTTTTGTGASSLMNWEGLKILDAKTNLFFTMPSATFNFFKNVSKAKTLANPKLRIVNKEKATIHIGDKVPIITSTTTQTSTVTFGNVQYVDVGIKLEAEPIITIDDEIRLKLKLEISSITGVTTLQNVTSAPQIGTRSISTVLILRDGETQVIGGLIQEIERNNTTKIPLLGDIPLIGYLLSNNDRSAKKTEILLSITPRIVRKIAIPSTGSINFWSGKEDDFSTKPPFESFKDDKAGSEIPEGKVPVQKPDTLENRTEPSISLILPDKAASDSEYTLKVNAENLKSVSGYSMKLTYEPDKFTVVAITEGDILKKENRGTSFEWKNFEKEGFILLTNSIKDAGKGIDGSGIVAAIVLKPLNKDVKPSFKLTDAAFTGTSGETIKAVVR